MVHQYLSEQLIDDGDRHSCQNYLRNEHGWTGVRFLNTTRKLVSDGIFGFYIDTKGNRIADIGSTRSISTTTS